MDILTHLVLGFFATLGFAVYFNVPIIAIFATCFTGSLGWTLYYILKSYNHAIVGVFMASLLIGVLSEYFAIKLKKPATVFIIPGITPMVPGAGTYYTMLYLIQNDFYKAIHSGAETLFTAAGIAIGIIFSSVFIDYIKKNKYSKQNY